jgi:hypothetical protein
MKFQKGLLNDAEQEEAAQRTVQPMVPAVNQRARPLDDQARTEPPPLVVKEHLFETVREETGSERNYVKLLGVVVVGVITVGIIIAYLTLPGVGDEVLAPKGLDLAVRDHFLTKEKRTATDITYYQCDGYYGARVGVETRTDIPNPLFRVDAYTARAAAKGGQWEITATPVTPPEAFVPCK